MTARMSQHAVTSVRTPDLGGRHVLARLTSTSPGLQHCSTHEPHAVKRAGTLPLRTTVSRSAVVIAQVLRLRRVWGSQRVVHSVGMTVRALRAQRTLRGAKSALACSLRGLLPSGSAPSGAGRPATPPRAPSASSGRRGAARPPSPEPRPAPRPTSASSGGSASSRVRSLVCLGERGSGTTGDARGAAGGAWRPGARSGTEGAPLLGGARERGGRVTQVRCTRIRSLRPVCMAFIDTTDPPLHLYSWRPIQVL